MREEQDPFWEIMEKQNRKSSKWGYGREAGPKQLVGLGKGWAELPHGYVP